LDSFGKVVQVMKPPPISVLTPCFNEAENIGPLLGRLVPVVASIRWGRRLPGFQPRTDCDFDRARPGFNNELVARTSSAERLLVDRNPLPIGVSLLACLEVNRRS